MNEHISVKVSPRYSGYEVIKDGDTFIALMQRKGLIWEGKHIMAGKDRLSLDDLDTRKTQRGLDPIEFQAYNELKFKLSVNAGVREKLPSAILDAVFK
jgi:hypothetical protein